LSHSDHIKHKLALLPDEPGCYLHKNEYGEIIYVGKAKNLKNRVRSYFTGAHDIKTMRLVAEIRDFEYIVTASELEALLLEMTLIKKHDPKYNIRLKDDKSYPYIKITNEPYPRLLTTRKLKRDGGFYFGPYPNAYAANETKRLLDKLYPLRKCQPMPRKLCLYYHIGQCLGPCELAIDTDEQKEIVQEIRRFLNGETSETLAKLQVDMGKAAEDMQFERAAELRDQIRAVESIMNKQNMITADPTARDVFGYTLDRGWMCVQVFYMRGGKMIERDVSLFPLHGEPSEELESFIVQFYEQNVVPKEVLVPEIVRIDLLNEAIGTKVMQPKRGAKRQLLDLATKNAGIARICRCRFLNDVQEISRNRLSLRPLEHFSFGKHTPIRLVGHHPHEIQYAIHGVVIKRAQAIQRVVLDCFSVMSILKPEQQLMQRSPEQDTASLHDDFEVGGQIRIRHTLLLMEQFIN